MPERLQWDASPGPSRPELQLPGPRVGEVPSNRTERSPQDGRYWARFNPACFSREQDPRKGASGPGS